MKNMRSVAICLFLYSGLFLSAAFSGPTDMSDAGLRPVSVHGPGNRTHPYYPVSGLRRLTQFRYYWDARRQRGIIDFSGGVSRTGNHRLFFIVRARHYRFGPYIYDCYWPVLVRGREIFIPREILQPVLSTAFPGRFVWVGDILIPQSFTKNPSIPERASPGKSAKRSIYSQKQSTSKVTIIIDAGHGGKDPGTIVEGKGKNVIYEKDITLQVARNLRRNLTRTGWRVVMTRETDQFIDLDTRTRIANRELLRSRQCVFVSLHVNSSPSGKTRGIEIFYLQPNERNEQERMQSTRSLDLFGGPEGPTMTAEGYLFSYYAQRRSAHLAGLMVRNLRTMMRYDARSKKIKKADFVVLRGSLMPAVLIEMGFLSNSGDRKLLLSRPYREGIARIIARTLIQFVRSEQDRI